MYGGAGRQKPKPEAPAQPQVKLHHFEALAEQTAAIKVSVQYMWGGIAGGQVCSPCRGEYAGGQVCSACGGNMLVDRCAVHVGGTCWWAGVQYRWAEYADVPCVPSLTPTTPLHPAQQAPLTSTSSCSPGTPLPPGHPVPPRPPPSLRCRLPPPPPLAAAPARHSPRTSSRAWLGCSSGTPRWRRGGRRRWRHSS